MALVTLCGVFPASLLLYFAVGPLIKDFPLPVKLFINSALMVMLLTWLIMPVLTKLVKAWLKR